jgi:23S rRNA pseudoU1915 N3-methylase RlmH
MPEHVHAEQANVVDLHPRTKGKRVLYVTNRADGVLQEELSRALQASRFKFGVVTPESPNRVRSMQLRGVGIGSEMMRKLLEAVRRQGCRELKVAPGGYEGDTERQMRFYAQHGFEPTEDGMVWRSPDA